MSLMSMIYTHFDMLMNSTLVAKPTVSMHVSWECYLVSAFVFFSNSFWNLNIMILQLVKFLIMDFLEDIL